MADSEIVEKQQRLGEFLHRHKLDGVFLQHRSNFAWITAGGDNHIMNGTLVGVAGILATADSRICFTNSIEAPRMEAEELAAAGIKVVSYRWSDALAGQRTLRELIAGRRIAADADGSGNFDHFNAGLSKLPDDFARLRWQLTPAEVGRFRDGAARAASAIEAACRRVEAGMTEFEIAGAIEDEVSRRQCIPLVSLVAVDDRIERFRHPIPTTQRLRRYAMIVNCSLFEGLITSCTRFVSVVPLTSELKRRQQAVVNVDAAVNLATRPGRTLGEIFADLEKAYAANGFAGEFKLHHQGGPAGYAPRDVVATPGSPEVVLESQAFAWNPSITGVKSEDTILCTAAGVEFLSAPSAQWPQLEAQVEGHTLFRPDILQL